MELLPLISLLAAPSADEAAPAASGLGLLPFLIPLLLLIVFMRWTKKKQEQQREALVSSLEIGQSVVTTGGFYGTIVDIDGGVVTLASPSGVETLWNRNNIVGQAEPPFAVEDEEEPDDEDDELDASAEVPDDASALIEGTELSEGTGLPDGTGDERRDERDN